MCKEGRWYCGRRPHPHKCYKPTMVPKYVSNKPYNLQLSLRLVLIVIHVEVIHLACLDELSDGCNSSKIPEKEIDIGLLQFISCLSKLHTCELHGFGQLSDAMIISISLLNKSNASAKVMGRVHPRLNITPSAHSLNMSSEPKSLRS